MEVLMKVLRLALNALNCKNLIMSIYDFPERLKK